MGSKNRKVILLTKLGNHRDELKKCLVDEEYEVTFADDFEQAMRLMGETKPLAVIHDWEIAELDPCIAFQQRVNKIDDFQPIIRILLAKEVTPMMLAIANDCYISRIVTHATAKMSLAGEIQMIAVAEGSKAKLQKVIRELHTNAREYRQEEIDDLVEDAFERYSHDPVVKLEYGNLQLRQNEYGQAKNLAEELLGQDPQNVRSMNLLSRSLMKMGELDQAIEVLEKANGLSPRNSERLSMLGKAFYSKGDISRASTYFEEALEVDPSFAMAAKGLCDIKVTQGDIHGAFDLIRNSLSEEEAAGYFNNAGVLAVKQDRLDEAVSLYESALESLSSDKHRPSILFNLALAYRKKNNLAKALRCLNRALKFDTAYLKAVKQKREIERLLKKSS